MNTQESLELLKKYLYNFDNQFIIHPYFIKEMAHLIKNDLKGKEALFFKQLATQLKNIISLKRKVNIADSNELLKNTGTDNSGNAWELYSIHFERKNCYNIRFIISFNENSDPLLLTTFNERAGKKRTDYTIPIKNAKERKTELL